VDVDVEERKREGSRFLDGRRKRKEEEKKIPGRRPASQSKKPKRAQGISTLTRSVLSDPPPPAHLFLFFFWSLPFPPHQERFFIPSVLLRSPDREIWSYWRSRGNKNGGFLYGFDALLRYIIVWALVGRHVTLFVTFVSGPW